MISTAQANDNRQVLEHRSDREGVYFLKVSGPETLKTDYDLSLEREVTGNNSCEQAETIELVRNERLVIEGSTRGFDNTFVPTCGHRNNQPRSAAPDAVYA